MDEDRTRISRVGILELAPECLLPYGIEPAERLAVVAAVEHVGEFAVLAQLVAAGTQPVRTEIAAAGGAAELQGQMQPLARRSLVEWIVLPPIGRAFGEISQLTF